MTNADILFYATLSIVGACLLAVAINYLRGLKGSPRELWLLYGYKFAESAAYKMIALSAVLWLSHDCGMSDKGAGNLYGAYSLCYSAMGIAVGALIDTAGIRKILLMSIGLLLFSRFNMVWLTAPTLAFILGLLPMALGFAIVSPLTSVAVKRYTDSKGAAYGFSLYYVLMNLGFTAGNQLYDLATKHFGKYNAEGKNIDQAFGVIIAGRHFSTYQVLIAGGFLITLVSLTVSTPLRDGVERDDNGVSITPRKPTGLGMLSSAKSTLVETGQKLASVASERFFWVFLGMVGLTLFVRSVFIQWDLILPKYCPRVMGEGAKVGAIYNVNTVLILLLVPVVTLVTHKVKSYTLMFVGVIISTLACFITAIPENYFAPLTDTVLGHAVFINWLGLAETPAALAANPPSPFYWSLIFSFLMFTIGEAIWSPRFYQFTAEIAPKGRESTYLALSVLPVFASKFFVGPLSGYLLNRYVPVDDKGLVLPHEHHHMIWVWIGVSAAITPMGMLFYKKFFERETAKIGAHLSDA